MIDPKLICFACMKELPSEDAVCPFCGHDNRLRGNGPGFLNSCMLGAQYLSGKARPGRFRHHLSRTGHAPGPEGCDQRVFSGRRGA